MYSVIKMYEVNHDISANAPTLWQCCRNVGANVVSILVPTFCQHSTIDTFKHPSNIVSTSRQHGYGYGYGNFIYMLEQPKHILQLTSSEHCVNIVPMLYFAQIPTLTQHGHNVGPHWPTFKQYSGIIVRM